MTFSSIEIASTASIIIGVLLIVYGLSTFPRKEEAAEDLMGSNSATDFSLPAREVVTLDFLNEPGGYEEKSVSAQGKSTCEPERTGRAGGFSSFLGTLRHPFRRKKPDIRVEDEAGFEKPTASGTLLEPRSPKTPPDSSGS